MSTHSIRQISRQLLIASACLASACLLTSGTLAQSPKIDVRVLSDSNRAAIEINSAPASSWSFLDSYAGIVGLGRRVERFTAFDATGAEVSVSQTAPGQFRSVKPARRISYEVNVQPVLRSSDFSRLSWLDKEGGVLMPLDLLPLSMDSAAVAEVRSIRFQLPPSWAVSSNETMLAPNEFAVADAGRAVFALGTNLRVSDLKLSGLTLNFVTKGAWAFSDPDVLQLAQQVLNAHRETFGAFPSRSATLILFPFPIAVPASQWSAETRGATVTLLMGKSPSKVAALAQLSTPLAHEFFHLWVPNALKLEGTYDWFYEGFTIYQASRTAVKLGLLTFPEFLNSIARAYDAARSDTSLSLIEASNRRFTSGVNSVYAKSQVIAFLYDLRLRSATRNRRGLGDVYRKLMKSRDASAQSSDGSEAVATILTDEIGSPEFVDSFIRHPVSVNLASELAPFGLTVDASAFRTQISVNPKPSKEQRDLLRELGYNAATHAPR